MVRNVCSSIVLGRTDRGCASVKRQTTASGASEPLTFQMLRWEFEENIMAKKAKKAAKKSAKKSKKASKKARR